MIDVTKLPCPVCRSRAVVGDKCGGCFEPLQRRIDAIKPLREIRCPLCRSTKYRNLADGTRMCLEIGCATQFEDYEFGYVDTRGENNAQKEEEYRLRQERNRHHAKGPRR